MITLNKHNGSTNRQSFGIGLDMLLNEFFDRDLAKDLFPSFGSDYGINLSVSEDHAVVAAALPGVSADDLEMSFEKNLLVIKGERNNKHHAEAKEGLRMVRQERPTGKFQRKIEIPFRVDEERIDATMSDGILTVTLPRKEEDKPKKITVKAG